MARAGDGDYMPTCPVVTLRLYGFGLQAPFVMTNAYLLRKYFIAGKRGYLLRSCPLSNSWSPY